MYVKSRYNTKISISLILIVSNNRGTFSTFPTLVEFPKHELYKMSMSGHKGISKQCIVHTLEAEVRASSTSNLKVRCLSEIELKFPHLFLTKSNTTSTSHVKACLGCGGFLVKIPFRKTHTCLCCPAGFPST